MYKLSFVLDILSEFPHTSRSLKSFEDDVKFNAAFKQKIPLPMVEYIDDESLSEVLRDHTDSYKYLYTYIVNRCPQEDYDLAPQSVKIVS